jgi:hypothetical protein
MTMKYRINDAKDSEKVNLELTMGQVRLLSKLAEATWSDIEEFGEFEGIKQKAVEKVIDRLMTLTHIQLTPEEEKAATDDWVKTFTHKDFVRVHGFDPYAVREVQS